jgi:hypothetical protein
VKFGIKRQVMRALLALSGVAASLCAPRAHAESDAASRALAVQLFDQAEALLAEQRTAEACPKYAESFRLDPQLGALIYLAECYEKNGQLASAWGSYREAEEMAQKRGDERAAHAHERASALEPRLDRLQIDVPQAARVPGLEVRRDGVIVEEALWGNAAAIDPGKHRIEVRASGYKPWQTDIDVSGEAKAANIAVPRLMVDASAVAQGGQKVAVSPGASQRVAAIVVGGAGVVALGVGGFFGLSAQSSYSDSKDLCSDSNICTQHGSDLRSSAKSKALVSTVATGVGVAGLATAVALWLTAPKAEGPEHSTPASARRDRRWAIAPNRDTWGLEVSGAF